MAPDFTIDLGEEDCYVAAEVCDQCCDEGGSVACAWVEFGDFPEDEKDFENVTCGAVLDADHCELLADQLKLMAEHLRGS